MKTCAEIKNIKIKFLKIFSSKINRQIILKGERLQNQKCGSYGTYSGW